MNDITVQQIKTDFSFGYASGCSQAVITQYQVRHAVADELRLRGFWFIPVTMVPVTRRGHRCPART